MVSSFFFSSNAWLRNPQYCSQFSCSDFGNSFSSYIQVNESKYVKTIIILVKLKIKNKSMVNRYIEFVGE